MIKFVFLDLDETLFDFKRSEADSLRKTLAHFGIPCDGHTEQRYSEINLSQWKLLEKGVLTRAQIKLRRFEILFAELGVTCDAEAARAYYEDEMSRSCFLLEGAEDLLRSLYGKYRLYVASNATAAVQVGRIAKVGIAHYFDDIFLSEQIGADKPQKAFFEGCFARIPDFDRSAAILLGDSLTSDIQGGINAGILTCHYYPHGDPPRAEIRPDFTISALAEFPALLEKL